MEEAIQFMMGTSLSVLGLSFFFCATPWMTWFKDVQKAGNEMSLPLGTLNLMVGSLIVGFHQIWEGWPLVITVIGLLMMVKGIVYLIFPGWMPRKIKMFTQTSMRPYLMFYGIAMLFVGMGTLKYWYLAMTEMNPAIIDMVFGGPYQ